jgi:ribosomal protein S18 acetylase RimI-like enzyme
MNPTAAVRNAELTDAAAIAAVHVASWKAAYRGMLPDDYLDSLSADDRLAQWEEWLRGGLEPGRVVVVEQTGLGVRGFASWRRQHERPQTAELGAMYLSPEAWGQGLGRLLLNTVVDRMRDRGCRDAVLWVHPDNQRARRFYEAAGWKHEDELKHFDLWGLSVPSTLYRRTLH